MTGGRKRRLSRFVLWGGVTLVLGVLVAIPLLRANGSPQGAMHWLDHARPWLVGGQILLLGLAWHFWPAILRSMQRRGSTTPEAAQALLAGRNRIFGLLAACEAIVVLRALFS